MLDQVERRRFLVEPAGKAAMELALRVAHVELDEGSGQLLHFPGRGRFAGAQPDDRVADPDRLARLQRQVLGQAVALVEKAEHGDPLRHRRRPRRLGGHGLRDIDRPRLGRAGLLRRLLAGPGAAAGQRQQAGGDQAGRLGPADHPSPGVQAS
jgi:hypothetical protein